MPMYADAAYDAKLAHIVGATVLHVCTAEPAAFAGVSAVSLGTVTPTFGASFTPNSGRMVGGRARTCTPGAGTYTQAGPAGYFALLSADSTLRAAGPLDSARDVNADGPIQVGAFDLWDPPSPPCRADAVPARSTSEDER